jgi:hypothetical protein
VKSKKKGIKRRDIGLIFLGPLHAQGIHLHYSNSLMLIAIQFYMSINCYRCNKYSNCRANSKIHTNSYFTNRIVLDIVENCCGNYLVHHRPPCLAHCPNPCVCSRERMTIAQQQLSLLQKVVLKGKGLFSLKTLHC